MECMTGCEGKGKVIEFLWDIGSVKSIKEDYEPPQQLERDDQGDITTKMSEMRRSEEVRI